MSFLIKCPNCGERSVDDFRFGGEVTTRPAKDAPHQEWTHYYYFRKNTAGAQQEWWYHKYGCRKWFKATRDTRTNIIQQTSWPEADAR